MKKIYEILEICCADREKRFSSQKLLNRIREVNVQKDFITSDANYQTNLKKLITSSDFFINYWNKFNSN